MTRKDTPALDLPQQQQHQLQDQVHCLSSSATVLTVSTRLDPSKVSHDDSSTAEESSSVVQVDVQAQVSRSNWMRNDRSVAISQDSKVLASTAIIPFATNHIPTTLTASLPLQQARPRSRSTSRSIPWTPSTYHGSTFPFHNVQVESHAINTTDFTNPTTNDYSTKPAHVVVHSQTKVTATMPTEETTSGCTCKRSKCLKLYCQCFASSSLCNGSKCRCADCQNITGCEQEIRQARSSVLYRNPNAFETKFQTCMGVAGTGIGSVGTIRRMVHPIPPIHPQSTHIHFMKHPTRTFHRTNILKSNMIIDPPSRPMESKNLPYHPYEYSYPRSHATSYSDVNTISKANSDIHSYKSHPTAVSSPAVDHSHTSERMHSQHYPSLVSTNLNSHYPSETSIFSSTQKHSMGAVSSAGRPTLLSHRSGCKCKKSSCVKKYCECFQMGAKCANICRCEDCQNRPKEEAFPQDPPSSDGSLTRVNSNIEKATAIQEDTIQDARIQDIQATSLRLDTPSYIPIHPSSAMPPYSDFPFRSQRFHRLDNHGRDGEYPQGKNQKPNTGLSPNVKGNVPNPSMSASNDTIENTEKIFRDEKRNTSSMSSFHALSTAAFMAKSTNPLDMMAAVAMAELACGVKSKDSSLSSTGTSTPTNSDDHKDLKRKRDDECMNSDLKRNDMKKNDLSPSDALGLKGDGSFESSSSSIENEPPKQPKIVSSSSKLPKSLSFRSVCSKCGRPRKVHDFFWFGGQCKMPSCGKCGVSIKEHESKGVSSGWNCSLTVSDGASLAIMKNYLTSIDGLAMTAELKKSVSNDLIYYQ